MMHYWRFVPNPAEFHLGFGTYRHKYRAMYGPAEDHGTYRHKCTPRTLWERQRCSGALCQLQRQRDEDLADVVERQIDRPTLELRVSAEGVQDEDDVAH